MKNFQKCETYFAKSIKIQKCETYFAKMKNFQNCEIGIWLISALSSGKPYSSSNQLAISIISTPSCKYFSWFVLAIIFLG